MNLRAAQSCIAVFLMATGTPIAPATAEELAKELDEATFVQTEWQRARAVLDRLPGRERIDARLSELITATSAARSTTVPLAQPDLHAPPSSTASRPDRFASMPDGRIVAAWPDAVGHVVFIHDARGAPAGSIPLPGTGTISRLLTDETGIHFDYSSFTQPSTGYVYSLGDQQAVLLTAAAVAFDSNRYLIERIDVPSGDALVPVVIVRQRQPASEVPPPVFVYVNAARGSRVPSGFSPPVANWLEMGGSFAFVHARGSGALGPDWQLAGQGNGKLAAVDDVLAAIATLEERKLAQRDRIVVHATGHSSLVLLAAVKRDPSIARAMWLSHAIADPLALPESSAVAAEYGARSGARALVDALFAVDSEDAGKLPPTLLTTALDQPAPVLAQSYRLARAIADRDPARVLLRAVRPPEDPAEADWALKDERVDVYAFLGNASGVL